MTTIREAIDGILARTEVQRIENTVDTIKAGEPNSPLTGVVTTFLATYEVIQRAAASGANLIIAHEPTFYDHRDNTDWLSGNSVYEAKRMLLDEHNIVVWRFHDYWHSVRPDGIMTGLFKALGWEDKVDKQTPYICNLAPIPLSELVSLLKQKLDIEGVRVAGSDDVTCRRVALLPGSPGDRFHISAFGQKGVDAVIAGEVNEWQVCEYARDAASAGLKQALIILGHEKSEEMGMRYLAEWLRPLLPGIPIQHVPAGEPFRTM